MELLVVDTTGIQQYIFNSNRLRENVGASYLVAEATGPWVFSTLEDMEVCSNILDAAQQTLSPGLHILQPDDGLDVEILYTGGGNAVLLFDSADLVDQFTRSLSLTALAYAPGLQLVFGRVAFAAEDSLTTALFEALGNVRRRKQAHVPSSPQLGIGASASCRSTGMPANRIVKHQTEQYAVSSEIYAKEEARKLAYARINALVPLHPGYQYPKEFEEFGRSKNDISYLAIVHADGNGMGKRLQRLSAQYPASTDNLAFIRAIRDFSDKLNHAGLQALRDTARDFMMNVDAGRIGRRQPSPSPVKLQDVGGKYIVPFRPIVYGGDDVTFVCDGRLGIGAAHNYLAHFERYASEIPGGSEGATQATACAGVAITKVHYPFARTYALAESLCHSAKHERRQLRELDPDWEGSCMDWHYAQSGLDNGLDEIRQREYTITGFRSGRIHERSLLLRPVVCDAKNILRTLSSWQFVEDMMGRLNAGKARNKRKDLPGTLRKGEQAVRTFTKKFGKLPAVSSYPQMEEEGWSGDTCGYFDALELLDLYIPLKATVDHALDA